MQVGRHEAANLTAAYCFGRITKRRFGVLLFMIIIMLLGLVALGPTAATRGQDATPLAGGLAFEIASGVTASILPTSEDPPFLYRVRFAPGAVYELDVSPAVSLVYVEAGNLVLRLDVPVTVMRAGATDLPGEQIAAGSAY